MATYPAQVTFGRGILSPRLHARYDIEHWRASLADAVNVVVMRQGGVRRREGSQYIGKTKSQTAGDKTRLIDFVFSATQAYVIELSDLAARFFALDGQVISGGSPYEIVTPWAEDDLDDIHFVVSGDTIYAIHPSYPPQKLKRIAETNWTCTDVDLEDGPYQAINTTSTRLTPSATGDIIPTMSAATTPSGNAYADVEYSASYAAWKAFDKNVDTAWISTQTSGLHALYYQFGSGKVVNGYSISAPSGSATGAITLTVLPGNFAPRRWLFQGSNDGSTWVTLDVQTGQTGWGDGERRFYSCTNSSSFEYFRLLISDRNDSNPQQAVGVGEWSLRGDGADKQTITITASAVTGINSGNGFSANDVGRQIRMYSDAAHWHWFTITTVNSTTSVDATVSGLPLPNVNEVTTWRLGAFSDQTGYPGAVTFYGDRLSYGRTNDQPRTKWTSRAVDLDDFSSSIPAQDDDAFELTIAEGGAINWLMEDDDILVGTDVSTRSIGKADSNAGFSATNFRLGRKIHSGSDRVQPITAGGATLFIERFGKAIREVIYSFEINGYKADDISILSEHLFASKLIRLAYCATPERIVWGLLEDGTLISVTYEREQQMVALTRHEIGGPDAFVESIAAIPGADGYELWMIVRRTKGAGILRSVEKIGPYSDNKDRNDECHLDCRTTYAGSAATTLTGLDDFNGMELSVYANGIPDGDTTVSGGAFVLASGNASTYAHFGFGFDSSITLLPLSPQQQDGSALGRRKSITKAIVSLMGSAGCRAQNNNGDIETILFRKASDPVDEPIPLFTGSREVRVLGSWLNKGEGFKILSDGPEQMIVRAVTPVIEGEP